MKKGNGLMFMALGCLGLFACKKNNDNVSSVTSANSSLQATLRANALQPKTVTIDASTTTSFYGNSGTRYIFYAGSFQTASGAAVTGDIQITVAEYLKRGDMIFSKMLPISNNEPLNSGGEVSVTATQYGQKLYIKPGAFFEARMPQGGAAPTGMVLFNGHDVAEKADTARFLTNWLKVSPDTVRNVNVLRANSGLDSLGIISDSLGMANADQFMTSPAYQAFTVTVKGATVTSSAVLYGYTLYDNIKALWPLGRIGSYANGIYTETHVPNIPVHFVVFGYINNQFYGGTSGATPLTGNNYNITLSQVDPAAFKAQLNDL
jgi:hypothetical protein